MIITSQGFGHFTQGLNNQDFGIDDSRMLLVLDGCSGAKYSEVGTRLFAQLFARREEWNSVEKFENNVKGVFDDIVEMMKKYYPVSTELKDFIMDNLLFTIIACFQTEQEFIVKLFGDGYVITQNKKECISYLRFSYGKFPPYFAYKYCDLSYKDVPFKTFRFPKQDFKNVAIATDGIMPIAKGDVSGVDRYLIEGSSDLVKMAIADRRQSFFDDITIGAFGGENNEHI